MNYLVHLSFSYHKPETISGNFIYDLLNSTEKRNVDEQLVSGIQLHKFIDHFSNNHESIRNMTKLLHPAVHKYAPVVSDVLCDWLIFQQWERWNLPSFAHVESTIYEHITKDFRIYPIRLHEPIRRMVSNRWLLNSSNLEGIKAVLLRLNAKLKFPADLLLSLPIIQSEEKYLDRLFIEFYQDMIQKLNSMDYPSK